VREWGRNAYYLGGRGERRPHFHLVEEGGSNLEEANTDFLRSPERIFGKIKGVMRGEKKTTT